MHPRRRRPQWPRLNQRVRLSVLGLAAVALLGTYLAAEHIPGWYRPPALTDGDLRRVRAELTELFDGIGLRLAGREPFTVVIEEQQANAWLGALPELGLDLDWGRDLQDLRLPAGFSAPAVSFAPDTIRCGAHFIRGGWQAILNADVSVDCRIDAGDVVISLQRVRSGSLPVPLAVARRLVAPPSLVASSLPSPSADAWRDDLTFRNRFLWPNGKLPFRIRAVHAERGLLTVELEPL
ncbi:MAG TPA: hypothetical protein PKK06_11165 [Phycisphaerae bacterium]|nr:hypothetical protein [Phycisphaerae bacterium]HNU45799.1 hypothetical protein [Phycisphaerae bacterium]